jgi:hypothetical protein
MAGAVTASLDVRRLLTYAVLASVLFVALALLLVNAPSSSWWEEDSVIEYATAAFAAIAAVLWAVAMKVAGSRGILLRPRDYVLTFLLAAVMVVLAGEEISWGQRILGIETPETLEEINAQGETNLHNIVPRTVILLYTATFAWAVLLPVLQLVSRWVHRLAWSVRCPVPPLFLASVFVSGLLFRIVFFAEYGNPAREGMELVISIAFVAVALFGAVKPEEIWVRPTESDDRDPLSPSHTAPEGAGAL